MRQLIPLDGYDHIEVNGTGDEISVTLFSIHPNGKPSADPIRITLNAKQWDKVANVILTTSASDEMS